MNPRTVVWFSGGITSAVAAKLVIDELGHEGVHLVYCETRSEHPDTERFIRECEAWLEHPVERIGSTEYTDVWDVWEKTRWLVGVQGARCTVEMKKVPRFAYQNPDDIHVWGYDVLEKKRIERALANNPDITLRFPLVEYGKTKIDCGRIIMEAGIELPLMYRLGYRNNNCVGCCKGQMGYWNKIRVDFPDVFDRMAKLERDIGAAICKTYAGDGKRKVVYLDELDPTMGNYKSEPELSCGISCGSQFDEEEAPR